jgi:hypothetical protein
MNLETNLRRIEKKLMQLEPNDPQTLMLRAVMDHELEHRMQALKLELAEIGIEKIEVRRNQRIRFYPYLPGRKVEELMSKYFDTDNNKIPVRIPPKYWGEHFISHP